MKGRIRRIEKKLSQNRETKILVIEKDWDSQNGRFHYYTSDKTLEFKSEDEMKKYFEELEKKQNCDYQLIIIDLVDTPQNALEEWYRSGLDESTITRWIEIHYNEDWKEHYTREEIEKIREEIRRKWGKEKASNRA